MTTLIKNVKILTPYNIILNNNLLVKDGKIIEILDEKNRKNKSFDGEIIDGGNNYLCPGFIDIHNHGNSGFDIMDAREEALDKISKFHIQNGVTSYLGTVVTSSYKDMLKAIDNIVEYENKSDLSEILGIHLEGPFFSIEKKGAQPEKYIKNPDLEYIEEVLKRSKNKLKMVSLAPEKKSSESLIEKLKENGVKIAMAHSMASYDEAIKAINSGVSIATHLFNGMRDFSHREPGLVGASLLDDRVFCELIYDRVHVHDAAASMAIRLKSVDKIVLVSDAMRAAGLEDGLYELAGQEVNVKGKEARLSSGALAGSLLNLNLAVKNMVEYLNIPIIDAVRMASINPARAIGVDKNKGSIEVGKDADLLLIDEKVNIIKVIKKGKVIEGS